MDTTRQIITEVNINHGLYPINSSKPMLEFDYIKVIKYCILI